MPKAPPLLRQLFFLISALCIAFFLQFRSQVPTFTFLQHRFHIQPGSLAVSAVLIYLLLIGLWALFSQILAKACSLKYKEALARDFWTCSPLVFFALTPLSLGHYLTFDDLQRRLGLFFMAVLFSVFYLKTVWAVHLIPEKPGFWLGWAQKFFLLSLRKRLLLLFLAALLIYSGASLLMHSNGISFSGDEPHYLLITHSLLNDGDFDLADNYARQDYSRYMAPQATVRAHTVPGKKPGTQYSFHSPGISLLLLPFYALGSFFGKSVLVLLLRLGMSIFGSLLGLQAYLYARQEWQKERLALGIWFLVSFTSPVVFYSLHIYPEIVIALFSFYIFRLLRFSSFFSKPRLLFSGLLLFSFIWFHALKYLFILGPLLVYALWILLKKHKVRLSLAYFFVFPVITTALYFYFQYSLYGSFNPTSVSWQGAMDSRETVSFLKSLLTGIPFRFRLESLAGYFLDQRDGLLFYAPAYFFAFLGLVEMARKKGKDFWLFLFVAGPYILVSAFLTQRTGYAPQARPLVAVIWGGAIFLGYFLAYNRKKIFAYLMNFAIALSLLFVWLLCSNPLALYQETTVGTTERGGDLFYILSNLHFYVPNCLPSFIKIDEWRWLPNFLWPVLLFVFMAAYILVRKHTFSLKFAHHLILMLSGLALFFVWFVAYPRITLVPPRKVDLPTGERLTFYALSRVALIRDDGNFSLLEGNRDYHFYFATRRAVEKLKVQYGSLHGDYELKLGFFDEPVFDETTRREIKAKILESPPAYRWKNSSLYRATIHLERKSDVRTGLNPYILGLQPVR